MLTLLAGGRVVDPANDRDEIGDLWIEDGRIVGPPQGETSDAIHRLEAAIVLAGGIDIHSHIAGANVNTARLLLPELRDPPEPISRMIGRLYAAMGFTCVVEPAIPPDVASQAHEELRAIPYIDTAILAVLGNEPYFLRLVQERAGETAIADYVARKLAGAHGLGLKVINPGGAAAFKANARSFGLDDEVPGTETTSRAIIRAAQAVVDRLGLPHPLHLHCNNLGIPGNVETALATIDAAEGRRLHLAHLQFYAYGTEGPRGFSSAAPRLAEAVNANRNITVDIGQVMFGQTVTVSCDVMRQFGARNAGRPRKAIIMEGEGNGGGIVPYDYRRTDFFNAVQFAAGLELFLLLADPWRTFFTTDHPNGAPFTAYPDLFALLMRRELRAQWLATLPQAALACTTLPTIAREYDWREIAIMTRAAPARLLGLADRGHLAPGARADVAVYRPQPTPENFRNARLVFKDGVLIARDGAMSEARRGHVLTVAPGYDAAIDHRLAGWYDDIYGIKHTAYDVPADPAFELVPCRV